MNEDSKKEWNAMVRRWVYMVVAIVAAAFIPTHPVFNFQDDKGIIYIRSFSMDEKTFYVTQTELTTGAAEVTSTVSVAGLYYCARVLFWLCVLCFLCFFSNRWRMIICIFIYICAGAYYLLMMHYAMKITDECYTTLYPNLMTFLPAIVLQMAVLVRRSVAHTVMIRNVNEEKEGELED